jgi:hypothetical protein
MQISTLALAVKIRGEDPVFKSSVYIFAVGFIDGIE